MNEPETADEALKIIYGPDFSEIWAVNYPEMIPFALQSFEVGSVLPATMYMFRRGHRRGAGTFHARFAPTEGEVLKKRQSSSTKSGPSVTSVSRILAADTEKFPGFENQMSRQILGDLLLCQCLENQHHESGRHLPLIRAFPTHYMASWIDLPRIVVDLRDVPESLVSILADQEKGEIIDSKECDNSWFRIGTDVERNLLLKVLGKGMQLGEGLADLHEEFEESETVGIDQLLTIRMAQVCGAAPQKLRSGKGGDIPNQHPVAKEASRALNEDFRILLQAYGLGSPRHCLLPMLESCICLGLTNAILSASTMMFGWERTGTLPHTASPWPLFVDASSSSERELRDF